VWQYGEVVVRQAAVETPRGWQVPRYERRSHGTPGGRLAESARGEAFAQHAYGVVCYRARRTRRRCSKTRERSRRYERRCLREQRPPNLPRAHAAFSRREGVQAARRRLRERCPRPNVRASVGGDALVPMRTERQ